MLVDWKTGDESDSYTGWVLNNRIFDVYKIKNGYYCSLSNGKSIFRDGFFPVNAIYDHDYYDITGKRSPLDKIKLFAEELIENRMWRIKNLDQNIFKEDKLHKSWEGSVTVENNYADFNYHLSIAGDGYVEDVYLSEYIVNGSKYRITIEEI